MTEKMVDTIVSGVVSLGLLVLSAYAVRVISNTRRINPMDGIDNGHEWTYSVRKLDNERKVR